LPGLSQASTRIQQFTEAAVLLTQLGRSPGDIGHLAFCSERSAESSPVRA
jgi:hypothetical protein